MLKVGIPEYVESTKVAAQTAAVLKSTGGAAGVTAKQVDALSSAILSKTGIDDEAIKSGENLLLTFTNIKNEAGAGNDVFTQTTKVMADMSVALGEDTKSAALQLGKALNDPIKGITALQRVGVSFTQAQKDQVRAMVESGRTMDAQKFILGELNKEFGGSAEAVGKTLPGQIAILRESFNNLAGDIVGSLAPSLQKAVTWTAENWPTIEQVFRTVFDGIGVAIQAGITAVRAIIPYAEQVVAYVRANWPQISATVTNVFNTVRATIMGFVATARAIWEQFGTTIVAVTRAKWGEIKAEFTGALNIIRGIVNVIGGLLHGDWSRVWLGLKQVFSGVVTAIKGMLRAELQGMVALVRGIGGAMLDAGRAIAVALRDGLMDALSSLGDKLSALFHAALARIQALPGQFYTAAKQIGVRIAQGILDGIGDLASRLKDKLVGSITGAVSAAGNVLTGSGPFMFTIHKIGKPLAAGIQQGFIIGMTGFAQTVTGIINIGIAAGQQALLTGFQTMYDAVSDFAGRLLAAVDAAVAAAALEAARRLGQGLGNVGSDIIGHFPGLAAGGSVAKTGLAVVHKGETFSGVGAHAMSPAGGGTTVNNFHFPNYVGNERELIRVVQEGLKREGQRNDTNGLLATRLT